MKLQIIFLLLVTYSLSLKLKTGQIGAIPYISPAAGPVEYTNINGDTAQILTTYAGLVEPTYMEKIPVNLNTPFTGEIAEANARVTNKFYYNGAEKLNVIKVDCGEFAKNPNGCFQSHGCGWCGETNTCVSGTPQGPNVKCIKDYFFDKPSKNWEPFKAGTMNFYVHDKKYEPLIHTTPTPDMSKVNVVNTYN